MRSLVVWLQPSSSHGAADNGTQGTRMAETSMRGSMPKEDASRAAAWAILTEVRRDRFPDVGRQWKLVVITPLPTHREHTGSPIDILQFQGKDFARTEPQARQ